ncbi:MAG: hypothetical protein AAF170_02070 [Bacteroidota bacterium]
MPGAGEARVAVFDVMGREVARLLDARVQGGRRQLEWDASDAAARIYLVPLARSEVQALNVSVGW